MIIRHKWNKITGSGMLKHSECEKCKCQRYYDLMYGQTVYINRFGKTLLHNPGCVIMNTKL